MNPDQAGERVLRFMSDAHNLSRIGELTDAIVRMADDGSWRRYRTALGVDEWRGAEFDYFLIACDLRHEDVSRVIAYSGKGRKIAPLMDRGAEEELRRPLALAAAAWHAPVPETLLERAARLGWSDGNGSLVAPPLSKRMQAVKPLEEIAAEHRVQRIPQERRAELDAFIAQLRDQDERRYVLERVVLAGKRRRCKQCGACFEPRNSAALYCSNRCRQKAKNDTHSRNRVKVAS